MAKVLWYYQHAGEEHGPVSSADLRRLAARGTLDPSDLVRRESMQEWVAAHQLRGVEFKQAVVKETSPVKSKKKPERKSPDRKSKEQVTPYQNHGEVAGLVRRVVASSIDSVIMLLLAFGGSFLGAYLAVTLLGDTFTQDLGFVDQIDPDNPMANMDNLQPMVDEVMAKLPELAGPFGIILGVMLSLTFLYEFLFEAEPSQGNSGENHLQD
ncbi:MAG: DUF4339 domain-containing protein [Planctomycetaceae bacterium]